MNVTGDAACPVTAPGPHTITVSDVTTDSAYTVNLAPAGPTASVSGVARTSKGEALGLWSVAFMPAGQPDQATIVTTAADGSYTAEVPESDDTVELFDGGAPDAPGQDFVRAGGLALTGPTTLDLTQPVVDLHVHVVDSEGRPVVRADMFTTGVGSTATPVPTGHLFAGSSGDVGVQSSNDGATDTSGDATIEVLQSTTASSIYGYYPGQDVDPGPDRVHPVSRPDPHHHASGVRGRARRRIGGRTELGHQPAHRPGDAVGGLATNYVYVPWSTGVIANALPGQAPSSDYVAASGTLVFLPGQTTPSPDHRSR